MKRSGVADRVRSAARSIPHAPDPVGKVWQEVGLHQAGSYSQGTAVFSVIVSLNPVQRIIGKPDLIRKSSRRRIAGGEVRCGR